MSDALDRARSLVLRPLPGQVAPPVRDSQAAQAIAMISIAEEIRLVRESLAAAPREHVVVLAVPAGALTTEQAARLRDVVQRGLSGGDR